VKYPERTSKLAHLAWTDSTPLHMWCCKIENLAPTIRYNFRSEWCRVRHTLCTSSRPSSTVFQILIWILRHRLTLAGGKQLHKRCDLDIAVERWWCGRSASRQLHSWKTFSLESIPRKSRIWRIEFTGLTPSIEKFVNTNIRLIDWLIDSIN
jgi:hypothetical protein